MMRRARGFGLFWLDFLVGDSPMLLFGVALILAMAFALREAIWMAAVVVPAAVILLLGVSVWRGTKARKK